MRALSAILSTSLVLGACGDPLSPPEGLPFSAVSYACSGMGIATAVELASQPIQAGEGPEFPYVRVTIIEHPRDLRRGTWLAPSDTAVARYVTGPSQYETGSGRVTFIRANTEAPVLGVVDLQFGSRRFSGEFRASWTSRPLACV